MMVLRQYRGELENVVGRLLCGAGRLEGAGEPDLLERALNWLPQYTLCSSVAWAKRCRAFLLSNGTVLYVLNGWYISFVS